MANTLREAMLEQELAEARQMLSYANTAIRNALTDIRDGDVDSAVETLEQIVGSPDEYQSDVHAAAGGMCQTAIER